MENGKILVPKGFTRIRPILRYDFPCGQDHKRKLALKVTAKVETDLLELVKALIKRM